MVLNTTSDEYAWSLRPSPVVGQNSCVHKWVCRCGWLWEIQPPKHASLLFSPFWIKVIPNENFLLTDYVRHGLFACVTVFIQKGLFFYNHTRPSLAVVRELHCWNMQTTWPWWLTWLAPLLCTQSTTCSKHSVRIVTIHWRGCFQNLTCQPSEIPQTRHPMTLADEVDIWNKFMVYCSTGYIT